MPSTLLRMKAVPPMAVFSKHDVTIGMEIFCRLDGKTLQDFTSFILQH